MPPRPRILVTNDDGINAPGLKALVSALISANFADVLVSAPNGERSAQSHAITLGRYMSCAPAEINGVQEAWAVDGTPADSVMLAMHSGMFKDTNFDLCVSGINRGDNCGLHVVYSGTVGAAREAACKGTPSIALSLDNHMARKESDYTLSASLSATLIKAMLGLMPGQAQAPAAALAGGHMLTVNFPIAQGQMLQGFYQTHQSLACVFPAFKEVSEAPGPHLAEIDEHTPNSRVFRNYAGLVQEDDAEGGDAWAVRNGWVSVTPLGLRSHITGAVDSRTDAVMGATAEIIRLAAGEAGIGTGGISKL